MNTRFLFSTLALAASLSFGPAAIAQVAGTTVLGVSVSEVTQVAMGWSAKRSVLGKTVYNDAGAKIGKVEDLIIDPERNVSYVIIGAGGFIGIGRHDVAVPVAQVKNIAGRLVMANAKAGLALQANALQIEVKASEARLGEMNAASAARWKEFEAGVNAATARLRKNLDTSNG